MNNIFANNKATVHRMTIEFIQPPNPPAKHHKASSTTQSRTTIKTWQISGTGVNVAVEGLDRSGRAVHSLESVKHTEFWRHDDDLGLMMQLGIAPAQAA
jgi:hypothetical protein